MEDDTVFSRQTLFFPGNGGKGISAAWLLDRYLSLISRYTFGIVRVVRSPATVDFRLLGTRINLLSFTCPPCSPAGELALALAGGILLERGHCDRGMLSFGVAPGEEGRLVTILLSGYCPMILGGGPPSAMRRLLYRWTQALIHRRLTEHFLADLYRERYGPGACLTVTRSGPVEQRI